MANRPVTCENCNTKASIDAPSKEQLAAGILWLCAECGTMNSLGGPR